MQTEAPGNLESNRSAAESGIDLPANEHTSDLLGATVESKSPMLAGYFS